jgi:hypothetical protein
MRPSASGPLLCGQSGCVANTGDVPLDVEKREAGVAD